MIRPEEINSELSKSLFENFDSKYSESNRYNSFDPNIINNFLDYLGYAGGFITIAEAMKKFIDFIKSRKEKEDLTENLIRRTDKPKDGTISIKRLYPGNVLMMMGNGSRKPIIEACNTMPLFAIQRGYLMILTGLIIHINYDPHKLVKEYKAPAFIYDDSVEITKTSNCNETPGLFRVRESIWVGKPDNVQNKHKGRIKI